jgi:histidinol-phosphate aminotransferase
MALTRAQVEEIVKRNPDSVVVIDEAYVDFGGESCIPLIKQYDNLLVIQTFSKSRSMAGARLGFAAGNEALIRDLNTIKYSINPYNINSMTLALGLGVLLDEETTRKNCRAIMENRAYTVAELEGLGFTVLPSSANFIFAKSGRIGGKDLYLKLKERGVLIRHFDKDPIRDWTRITIGTREQMDVMLKNIRELLEETP